MRNLNCETCGHRIPTGEAVLRGDGRRVRAFHRGDCATVDGIAHTAAHLERV